MARTVTMIPASVTSRFSNLSVSVPKQRRVAAYARVSTEKEEQLSSYEAQVDYYTKYIKERPDWDFVFVYTDEGITATNTKKRDGFNQMIKDALDGKIDLIVTKSVSRFARNTVDSLTAVRKLKDANIEIYFEKENIWTFDAKGELLITIMSSLAQEESRSISENVTWGWRKRIADGKVSMAYGQFLGYEKGADGTPQVVPEEAEIVRRIYTMFLQGKTPTAIAKHLTAQGIPTPGGKEKWQCTVVESILTNEKYKGDALLQKTFTTDFLTKKMKPNEGEVPQFYVTDSHDGIIDPEDFDMVQAEFARRKALGRSYTCKSCFSTRLVCGDCGGFYGSKVWHSNDKYRRVIWQCNSKFKNGEKCTTPHMTEDDIKSRFIAAWNGLQDIRDEVIIECRLAIADLFDSVAIDEEIAAKNSEAEVLIEMNRKHIAENATAAQNQKAYKKRQDELVTKYNDVSKRITELKAEKEARKKQHTVLTAFVDTMERQHGTLTEFSESLWLAIVEKATVYADGRLVFTLMNGTEIE
ncbi:MAG TPA: recombinase family protein [Spirochaetia bacterium]|nr:recombinase family protein [Spirochaetia bacterium]HRV27210.1 recombinase family protein [Spirochaetia bacterium]